MFQAIKQQHQHLLTALPAHTKLSASVSAPPPNSTPNSVSGATIRLKTDLLSFFITKSIKIRRQSMEIPRIVKTANRKPANVHIFKGTNCSQYFLWLVNSVLLLGFYPIAHLGLDLIAGTHSPVLKIRNTISKAIPFPKKYHFQRNKFSQFTAFSAFH